MFNFNDNQEELSSLMTSLNEVRLLDIADDTDSAKLALPDGVHSGFK